MAASTHDRWMSLQRWALAGFLVVIAAARAAAATDGELTPVRLELCYFHQFQFAGYYAADLKGFYRDAGLLVTIEELNPGSEPMADASAGRCDFAVGGNSIFARWAAGEDIFLLAQVFQVDTRVLIVHADSPWKTMADLAAMPKERMVGPMVSMDSDFALGLKSIGQEPATFFPRAKNPDDLERFAKGDLWLIPGSRANEALRLNAAGVPVRIIEPVQGRTLFPGDSLVCGGELWRHHRDLAARFRAASMRGWEYALDHPDEIIDHILAKRHSAHQVNERDHLEAEAAIEAELIDPDRFPIGSIDPARLRAIVSALRGAGLPAPAELPEDRFWHEPGPGRMLTWLGGALALSAFIGIALAWYARNQRKRLQRNQELFQRLIDLAEGLCVFRLMVEAGGVRLVQASATLERLTGHGESYYRGDIHRLYEQIPTEDRVRLNAMWRSHDPRGTLPIRERFRLTVPGQTRPRHLMVHAVTSLVPEGLEIDGVCLDLTAEAEAEAERTHLAQQLQLAQRHESLGLLASGIAHDFNNLLGAIRGNAELLTPLITHDDAGKRRLGRVMQAVDRAAGLVRQILAYTGRGSIVARPLDLAEEARQIRDLLRHTLPRGVSVKLDAEAGLPRVRCDPAQFQQVLVNLVVNAAESYEGRPGTVTVTLDAAPNKQVRLVVTDQGVGMDDQVRARLFEPYFTTKAGGHGLGLAAVQGIVRSANGTITCQSQRLVGTTFTICLPADLAASTSSSRPASVILPARTRRVLVVDDDEGLRELAAEMLTALGYEPVLADGGISAREQLDRSRATFAAMVLDCRMPDVDGRTILRELRTRGDRLPVILISGMSAGGDLSEELADPRTRFLAKPYTRNALHQLLLGLLGDATPASAPPMEKKSVSSSSRQTTNDDDSSFEKLVP